MLFCSATWLRSASRRSGTKHVDSHLSNCRWLAIWGRNLASKSGRIRPNSVELEQALAQTRPNSSNIDRHWPGLAWNRPKSGGVRLSCGRAFDQTRLSCGIKHIWAEFGRSSADVNQVRTTSARHRPDLDRNRADLGQLWRKARVPSSRRDCFAPGRSRWQNDTPESFVTGAQYAVREAYGVRGVRPIGVPHLRRLRGEHGERRVLSRGAHSCSASRAAPRVSLTLARRLPLR